MRALSRTTYKHIRHKEKSAHFIKKRIMNHWMVYLIFLLMLVGVMSGVIYARNASDQNLQNLRYIFNIHDNMVGTKSAIDVFTGSFSSAFIVISLIFVFGFCAIGSPALVFLCFLQGFSFGLSAGYVYASLGAKGILYNIAILVPCSVIVFFITLYASKNAIDLSLSLFKVVFLSGKDDKLSINTGEYIVKFIIYILLLFAKALIETLSMLIFLGFFK